MASIYCRCVLINCNIMKFTHLITFLVVMLCSSVMCFESSETDGKILKPGSDADFSCDYFVKNTPTAHRKWIKTFEGGKFQNITENRLVIIKDARFSVATPKDRSSLRRDREAYVLSIKNIRVDDSGIYECQIYFTDGSQSRKKVSLFVFPTDVQHQTVLEGDDAHLSCFPERYFPIFNVTWTKGQEPKENVINNEDLIIPSTILNDSATYTCKSMINIYDMDRYRQRPFWRDIRLEVVPLLQVNVRNEIINRPVGYNVNITCFIRSLVPVTVTWFRDGEKLIPKNDTVLPVSYDMNLYEIGTDESKQRTRKVASLQLKNITKLDYGSYKCEIVNELDVKSSLVKLTNNFINLIPDQK